MKVTFDKIANVLHAELLFNIKKNYLFELKLQKKFE